jgi:hypothetical protein
MLWAAPTPIQMTTSLALLIPNLGPSEGFSVFFILTPVLGRAHEVAVHDSSKGDGVDGSYSEPNWWVQETGDEVILGIPVPCGLETLADYFSLPCAVKAIDLGSERGSGHVYSSDGILLGSSCCATLS